MKMEDQLALWRQLITVAQYELPELRSSLTPFFGFLRSQDNTFPDLSTESNPNETSSGEDNGVKGL